VLATLNPKAPAFAFLHTEGTQLHWKTIEALAEHKRGRGRYKVELLILFPLQMAPHRVWIDSCRRIASAVRRRCFISMH
jgi:hypothetical protein